jgi:hypothetical protein
MLSSRVIAVVSMLTHDARQLEFFTLVWTMFPAMCRTEAAGVETYEYAFCSVPSVLRGSRVLNHRVDPQCSYSNCVNHESCIPFARVGVLLCCTCRYLAVWTPYLSTRLIIITPLFLRNVLQVDSSDRVGLRPLACLHCGFEPHRGHGCLPPVSVVCFLVEVSASVPNLPREESAECGVSEYDREASIVKSPWPTGDCCAMWGKNVYQRGNHLTNVSCI